MGKLQDFEVVSALAANPRAERKTLARFEVDFAGGCEAPATFDLFGRPQQFDISPRDTSNDWQAVPYKVRKMLLKHLASQGFKQTPSSQYRFDPGSNHPIWVVLSARCRKCEWCRQQRANLWATKARREIEAASRTWFCTYTLSPDDHFRVETAARVADAENGDVFEARSEQSQFVARCAVLSPEITRYVKRVRKQSGAPLRYLFVTEKHKTGLPHFHALFHETNPAMPLRKAVLKEQWKLGFTRFKLVETPSAAWYLCKYLSKEQATRVRGSLFYGRNDLKS